MAKSTKRRKVAAGRDWELWIATSAAGDTSLMIKLFISTEHTDIHSGLSDMVALELGEIDNG